MKSIFLLCEFGVPYNTVLSLYKNNIMIDDIINNNDVLNNIVTVDKKSIILKKIEKVISFPDENSVYELIEFGLSKTIVEKLISNDVRLRDLNDNTTKKYNIGVATYSKIKLAFNCFLSVKQLQIELTENDLLNFITNKYNNIEFDILELKQMLNKNNFKFDFKTEEDLQILVAKEKIKKKGYLYFVPYSIETLLKYGLNDRILNCLKENDIQLSDIQEEDFCIKYQITPSRYNKIITAYDKFVQDVNYCGELTKNRMLNIIKKEFQNDSFTILQLLSKIESNNLLTEKVKEFLDMLINSDNIVDINGAYRVPYPTLDEEISKINNNNNHRDMVLKKLTGYTLEQIGNEYGVTRERIRQIIAKELKKIPIVKEEKFRDYFTKYNFDVNTFKAFFNQDEKVYYYLREKYSIGDCEISELLNEGQISEEQIRVISEKYNLINIYNENIIASKNDILVAILKFLDRQVEFEELRVTYNEIINTYNLDLEEIGSKEFRNIDGILTRSLFVLNTLGKKYRYYDFKNIEEDDRAELMELLNVEPGVYSAELFFNDNAFLMKKIGILDEYELHNLLRKYLKPSKDVIYSRMPDIYIKSNDKYKFTETLIQTLSPVTMDDFVALVYEFYGHKIPTFRAYLLSNFNEYINNEIISINSPKFNEKQFEFMKNYLKEDIYSNITIKQVLTDEFDVDDFELLNNLNFSDLGYKIRGNYILKSSINSFENYMRNLISDIDFYEIPSEMRKIGSTFSSYLYKFISEAKLFKYSDNTYITLKKINEMGVSENDIKDFIEKINVLIPENKYFNLFLLNADFESKLFDLKMPVCFYETLITIIPNVKMFKVNNNTMFIKTTETATKEKFINSFIVKNKIYIHEIKKNIKEIFDIDIQESYIKEAINEKKYYLQSNTECVYLSKEVYENEIKQWDILQYID